MKYVFLALGILFVLFAAVQLNDPDPVIWVITYLLVAVLSFIAFRNKFYPIPTIFFMLLCLVGAVLLFPPSLADWWQLEEEAKSLKMKMPGIEEARESMGLIISALILGIIYWKGRKFNKSKR